MASNGNRPFSLSVIQINSPCTEDWATMRGDAAVRFCSKCQLHVHNLSAMPADEAERLVQQRQGRLCVRVERPTTITPPLRRPPKSDHWWHRAAAMVGLSLVGVWGLTGIGCEQATQGEIVGPPPVAEPGCATAIMGAIAPPAERLVEMGDVAMPAERAGEPGAIVIPGPEAEAVMGEIAAPATQPATQPALEAGQ